MAEGEGSSQRGDRRQGDPLADRRIREHLYAIDAALSAKSVPPDERRSILADVETQIRDMLTERGGRCTPEDVEAVLRELDPPDSYGDGPPSPPKQPPTMALRRERPTLPTSLKIVAWLFIIGGIFSAVSMLVSLFFHHLEINFGVLGLFIGPGLLRLKRPWRTCALVLLWIAMVGLPIAVVLMLAQTRPLDLKLFGQKVGHAPKEIAVIVGVVAFAIAVWQYCVLTREDVRDLFGVAQPPATDPQQPVRTGYVILNVVLHGMLLMFLLAGCQFIVPHYMKMMDEFEFEFPAATKLVMYFSGFLADNVVLLPVGYIAFLAFDFLISRLLGRESVSNRARILWTVSVSAGLVLASVGIAVAVWRPFVSLINQMGSSGGG